LETAIETGCNVLTPLAKAAQQVSGTAHAGNSKVCGSESGQMDRESIGVGTIQMGSTPFQLCVKSSERVKSLCGSPIAGFEQKVCKKTSNFKLGSSKTIAARPHFELRGCTTRRQSTSHGYQYNRDPRKNRRDSIEFVSLSNGAPQTQGDLAQVELIYGVRINASEEVFSKKKRAIRRREGLTGAFHGRRLDPANLLS
jgi:hypothetical protein